MKNTVTKIGEKILTPILNYLIFLNTRKLASFHLKNELKMIKEYILKNMMRLKFLNFILNIYLIPQ
jgi:hypothetical protein